MDTTDLIKRAEEIKKEAGVYNRAVGALSRFRTGAKDLASRAVPPTTKGKVLAGVGAVAGTGAILGSAVATKKIAPIIQGFGQKQTVEFTDKTKKSIRWYTYNGGPVIEGPTDIMKNLFSTGKSNRTQGLILLARLLKAGTIKIVGKNT